MNYYCSLWFTCTCTGARARASNNVIRSFLRCSIYGLLFAGCAPQNRKCIRTRSSPLSCFAYTTLVRLSCAIGTWKRQIMCKHYSFHNSCFGRPSVQSTNIHAGHQIHSLAVCARSYGRQQGVHLMDGRLNMELLKCLPYAIWAINCRQCLLFRLFSVPSFNRLLRYEHAWFHISHSFFLMFAAVTTQINMQNG